ncbi:MAG TPA: hypothetical protein VLU46_02835, partial [Thermoanaerobaculia bacterium]|nr:hypothetical protein [Thermoanaerobaculia bacterium]
MHPLRVTLLVSLAIAIVVAVAFGYALQRLGVASAEVFVVAATVFLAFLVPWVAVFAWALRRANDIDELHERMRRVARGEYERAIADRSFHGEIDD